MTDRPFKLRVLHALTDIIKEVTPGNGYVCDLADFVDDDDVAMQRVFRGRAWFGEDDPLPMVSILEAVSPADEVVDMPTISASNEIDWQLLVQGFVNDDAANPTDPAYILLADVQRRLAQEKLRTAPGTRQPDPLGLGITGRNKILKMSFGSGVVRPADDVSAKAFWWMPVTLRMIFHPDAPYA